MRETDNTQRYNKNANPRPDKIARTKHGHGKNTSFETIGVGWTRDDGSVYLKPYGTQIIDQGVYIFDTHADASDNGPGNTFE